MFFSEEAWTNGMREYVYEFSLKYDMGDVYKCYNEENGSLPSLDVPRTYDESLLKQLPDCFDLFETLEIPCTRLTTDECPTGSGNVARIIYDPCKPESSICRYT